jgi:hypothetical protein
MHQSRWDDHWDQDVPFFVPVERIFEGPGNPGQYEHVVAKKTQLLTLIIFKTVRPN